MARKSGFQLPADNQVPEIDPERLSAFSQGAKDRATETAPWRGLDPKAKPTSGINLRLNDYQLALIRFVAEQEERSQQQVIKRVLVPGLEAMAHKALGRGK